ncbi:MAG: hypothetical protein JST64_07290 [Actinobacteria bacterium]|nr:hypothetical protein [Actinomycetota bacterium]
MTIAEVVNRRGRWPTGDAADGREVLSWLVVASLLEGDVDLGVAETHPGPPGERDCLSVYDRTCPERGPILDLDRLGAAHIAPLDGSGAIWDSFWVECAEDGPVAVAGRLRLRCRLRTPRQHNGIESFAVSQIARRLLKLYVARIDGSWECRNGVADSSAGQERRISLFRQMPAAMDRLTSAPSHQLGDPAHHFWFLLRDGVPVSCIDTFH